MQVAEATRAALGDQFARPVVRQIREHRACFGVGDHGANRHPKRHVVRSRAVAICAAAVAAFVRTVNTRKAVVDQRVDIFVGFGVDAAAASAVATVGSAAWNKFFAAKRRHAIAAVAGD